MRQTTALDYKHEEQEHQKTKQDYEIEKRIVEMDRELLNSVSKLAKGSNPGEEFDILTENILRIVSELDLLNDSGISIFCPDAEDNDYCGQIRNLCS